MMAAIGGAHLLRTHRREANGAHRAGSSEFIDRVGNLDSFTELNNVNLLERVSVHLEQDVTGDFVF
jgi:hypothetical protein